MAYDKDELAQQALEAIEGENLITIDEVVSLLPCSRATFYNLGLDKLDTIKAAINNNKTEIKVKLRNKWIKSDSAALQIALYKLSASNEEKEALGQKVDHTTKGEKIEFPVPNFSDNEDS